MRVKPLRGFGVSGDDLFSIDMYSLREWYATGGIICLFRVPKSHGIFYMGFESGSTYFSGNVLFSSSVCSAWQGCQADTTHDYNESLFHSLTNA
jgi:hypothetical protein